MVNINYDEKEICEPCADHVCNENCGCELSDDAIKSVIEFKSKELKKQTNEYLEFLNLFGGINNINKIWKKGNSIYFELVNVVNYIDWDKVSLFNNYSVEILNNIIKLSYKNIDQVRERIFDTTTIVLNEMKK